MAWEEGTADRRELVDGRLAARSGRIRLPGLSWTGLRAPSSHVPGSAARGQRVRLVGAPPLSKHAGGARCFCSSWFLEVESAGLWSHMRFLLLIVGSTSPCRLPHRTHSGNACSPCPGKPLV